MKNPRIAGLTIVRARPDDAGEIYGLIVLGTKRGKVLKRPLNEIRRQIGIFFIARIGGRPVGCVALDVYNRKLAEVRSLVVRAPWERRSIATRLIQACLREAGRRGVYEVLVITDRHRLFRRFGFREELHGQKALFHRP